jgi:hypothetical protein
MKRIVTSLTLALVALGLLAGTVGAGREWCYKDPVVTFNGTAVQVLVAVPEEYVPAVNGAIDVDFAVPAGVTHQIDFLDNGFNGYGEAVSFQTLPGAMVAADGSFDVNLRVIVPVSAGGPDGTIPVQVTVVTNGELTWQGSLPAVVNGDTAVVEGDSNGTYATVTVYGTN